MDNSWKSELTPDMLDDALHCAIAEEIGSDNLLKLSRLLGGDFFYVPLESSLLRRLRNKKIVEEYAGYNVKELSKKYGVTPRTVYSIVSQAQLDNTN